MPTPGDNDLLIKIGAAGFCHTEYVKNNVSPFHAFFVHHRAVAGADVQNSYQVWEGVYESPTPLVPSHEHVGTIVAIGSQAQKSGKWKVGQRAGVLLFRHACHHCVGCDSTGDVRFCKNKDMAGLANDGGMAEYIIGDADNSVLLPDNLPFEQAAPLMCAGVRYP